MNPYPWLTYAGWAGLSAALVWVWMLKRHERRRAKIARRFTRGHGRG